MSPSWVRLLEASWFAFFFFLSHVFEGKKGTNQRILGGRNTLSNENDGSEAHNGNTTHNQELRRSAPSVKFSFLSPNKEKDLQTIPSQW